MTCVHHWLIGAPDGHATVDATCRRCGATREFVVSPLDQPANRRWSASKSVKLRMRIETEASA